MATMDEIKRILALLSVLPNKTLREDNLEVGLEAYSLVLKDLDFEILQAAAAQYLSTATFFPTPGNLREAALELMLSAQGIPTPAEAWGSLATSRKTDDAVYCEERTRICNLPDTAETYWNKIDTLREHKKTCQVCKSPQTTEIFAHPLIGEVVRLLGGSDRLFTNNLTADRARFIEAYKERLEREKKEMARLPEVTSYIEKRRKVTDLNLSQEFKQLKDKWSE
jgi:hypothetical protein